MSRNSHHAMRHPCWTGSAYRCDCGNVSQSLEDHRKHLLGSSRCLAYNATVGDRKWVIDEAYRIKQASRP